MNYAIRYKSLKLFHIAACSLIYAGFFSVTNSQWPNLILLTCCTIIGIFFVYRFNDHVDQTHDFKVNLHSFFRVKLHLLAAVIFLLIFLPLSIYSFSSFCFLVLALAGILGILYSVKIHLPHRSFRLKHAFLFKNIAIGLAWGALVLIGADSFDHDFARALFYFVSVQVFIGSAIRDIPDLEKDRQDGVYSLAVVFGVNPAIFFLHLVNVASVFTYGLVQGNMGFLFVVSITYVWRFITLRQIFLGRSIKRWTQSYNLMTCFLIFVLVFITYVYEHIT
ncbi:MAG: UbiA family prenyltransferase [Bacteroidota bacterium]